jgi:DNA topoisomerase-3
LFRRKYVERKKKLLIPTTTGIQLIDTIQNELLKSAELTGRWEKRLKEIEQGTFNAGTFIKNMKKMVDNLVYEVRSEQKRANISQTAIASEKKMQPPTKKTKGITQEKCPKCKKGTILKGKTAFGCSAYKNGCDLKLPFTFLEKKISENQFIRLLQKGCTVNLKGFKKNNVSIEGLIRFDEGFNLILEEKKNPDKNHEIPASAGMTTKTPEQINCPKCKKGTILKGKTAYGCSDYKNGCDFVYSFDDIRKKAAGQTLSKALVFKILNGR